MLRRFACTVAPHDDGRRLDVFVADWLEREIGERLSKSAVRTLIVASVIRVNGRVTARAGVPLTTGSRLQADVDLAKIHRHDAPSRAPDLRVLYEDDDLLAVDKPAGLMMHATADRARLDLFEAVRRVLAARCSRLPSGDRLPYLGLHHRLDIGTSGVVLFSKRERANGSLARQFAAGRVMKTYHAIVSRRPGRLPRQWTVDDRLALHGTGRHARMAPAPTGAVAVTQFRLLEALPRALLIEAVPKTGRKHQIRAHLAAWGAPLVGDARYGGLTRVGGYAIPRVMLHARRLSLLHPVTGRPLTIECECPADFRETLNCLSGRYTIRADE